MLTQTAVQGVRYAQGVLAPCRDEAEPRQRGEASRRGWKWYALLAIALPLVVLCFVTGYYYVTFSRMIDGRLHGAMQRADPRVFARPFEVRRGQAVSAQQLVDRLNDLGYANRARAETPGEFTVGREAIAIMPARRRPARSAAPHRFRLAREDTRSDRDRPHRSCRDE